MGKINLLIANASGYFNDDDVRALQAGAEKAESFISDHLPFDYDVDVVVTAPSFLLSTIPEDGISGRTYHSRLIALVLDKDQKAVSEDSVYETICHEMSHSLRWEKLPEYSKTLFDAMIFEGLAIAMEEKAVEAVGQASKQYFLSEMQRTDQDAIDRMIDELKESFESEQYDYNMVFFTGNDTLPRWAGYRLGYYFVKQQLAKGDTSLEELTTASYSLFSSGN
jgi:uncharacterized protein YjaZ